MKYIIILMVLISSCTDQIEDVSYISVQGDTIYDPVVIAENAVYCYGGYRFKVSVSGELPSGESVKFILISDELSGTEQISIHEYETGLSSSLCGDSGVIVPYYNAVDNNYSNIGVETFDLIGNVGMECLQSVGNEWKPIDADLVINLVNIKIPRI